MPTFQLATTLGEPRHATGRARNTAFPVQVQENLGPYLNRVIWVLAALSAIFLGLRLYCKLSRRRHLWWDDHLLIASWTSLVVSTSLQSAAVRHGLGKHYYDLDLQSIDTVALFSISAGFAGILATTWSKTSFAISLLRISDGRMRVFIWFIIISVNMVMAANGTIQWVQCWPVEKLWNASMEATCLPPHVVQVYDTFVSAYSGMMDIVLAFLPWKVVWAVAIDRREKLGTLVAMSLGILAGIISFLKIMTLYVIGDDNETTVDLFVFGTAEPATAIMAASMPFLRVLFQRKPLRPSRFVEVTESGRVALSDPQKTKDLEDLPRLVTLQGGGDGGHV